MAQGVKHDYHLVNPSPWPLTGSITAFIMALGGVIWMKGLFGLEKGTSWVFFAGLAGVHGRSPLLRLQCRATIPE